MISFLVASWHLVAGVIVLFLPGVAWLALFWDADQDPLERLAQAIGVSIALTALGALVAFLLGWQISSAGLIALYGLLLLLAVWGVTNHLKWRSRVKDVPEARLSGPSLPGLLHVAGLGAVFLLILAWRFYQVREFALPAWVDSVHHVLIVRLILENQGLPDTLDPYLPVMFLYHFAFHALGAVYSFLARLAPEQAVLLLGQILNAAVALSVYRLGKALWGDWRRAILSALLVGFVTQMPAYYATWGRYTLLAGMVLLPLAMADAVDIVQKGPTRARLASLAILTGGLFLAHYFATYLFAIFLVFLGCQALFWDYRQRTLIKDSRWLPLAGAVLVGAILAAPWLSRMEGYAQGAMRLGVLSPSIEAVEEVYFPRYLPYLWHLLGPLRNQVLLIPAVLGLAIAMWRWRIRALAIWGLALGLFSLPWGVYLAPFRPDHVVIVLFLPIALFVSDILVSLLDWWNHMRFSWVKNFAVMLASLFLFGWGIWTTRSMLNPATVLATQADLQAIQWIDANLPQEARFLINVSHWQAGIFRGVDGGWWITPLTGRWTSLPAVLYTMGEKEYVDQVKSLAERTSRLQGCTPEFWEIIRTAGITHIYLSKGKGSLQPNNLENCPNLELIYQAGGISVYRVVN